MQSTGSQRDGHDLGMEQQSMVTNCFLVMRTLRLSLLATFKCWSVEHHPEWTSESRQNAWQDKCAIQYYNCIHHAVHWIPRIYFIMKLCTFWPFHPFYPPPTPSLQWPPICSLFTVFWACFFFWSPCINEIIQYLTYFI